MTVHEPIAMPTTHEKWRVHVRDFLLLEENGAFSDYARAELLDGEIWLVNAIHSRHAGVQAELLGRLWSALTAMNSDLRTYIAPAVEVSDVSLPEPDLVVGQRQAEGFFPVEKVAILIEVSDSTLKVDLGRKKRIYAEAGFGEYWVADVNRCVIHQFWTPRDGAYADAREVPFGQPIRSIVLPDLVIATDAL
jgi:Uma2 family endonuclease